MRCRRAARGSSARPASPERSSVQRPIHATPARAACQRPHCRGSCQSRRARGALDLVLRMHECAAAQQQHALPLHSEALGFARQRLGLDGPRAKRTGTVGASYRPSAVAMPKASRCKQWGQCLPAAHRRQPCAKLTNRSIVKCALLAQPGPGLRWNGFQPPARRREVSPQPTGSRSNVCKNYAAVWPPRRLRPDDSRGTRCRRCSASVGESGGLACCSR